MNFVSYSDLIRDIKEWSKELPKDFDLIVAIPRSGLLPSVILSLYLNISLSVINEFAKNNCIFRGGIRNNLSSKKISKILVLDDSVYSGREMSIAKDLLKNKSNLDIKYGAVYCLPGKEDIVDYFFKIIEAPRYFEWNIMHHSLLSNACVDIDGVLCEDPTEEQNDDSKRYLEFLANTKPLIIPSCKIKYLITCRLNKYQKQTKKWLSRYNIKYDGLIMMDYPDKETRLRAGNHAEFKADFYIKSECILFIESSKWQAEKIAKLSKKPVLCTENMKLYHFKKLREVVRAIAKRFIN